MERENFGSRLGTLAALAGSAIGLGNIWRFPYMVGVYGGAAFIFVYVILVFLLCLPILCAEYITGRRSRSGAFGAFKKLAPGSNWKWTGALMVTTSMLVLSYYSVIGGWSFDYLLQACCFNFTADVTRDDLSGIFGSFVSSAWKPVVTHTVFMLMTALIVACGVKKGIEAFSKLMLPLLFVLIVVIAVRAVTLPGAMAGVEYLFKPDFSKINPSVCVGALGQAFYSLSLGYGIVLTYSSYAKKDDNIGTSSAYTVISDFMFALLASCAILPAVFAFGIDPQQGPGLVFQALPFIFSKMSMGGVIAILFFVALLVAALTSSISLFEVGVAYFVEEKHVSRRTSTIIVFLITWLVGIICALSFGPLSGLHVCGWTVFDLFDKLSANFLMPLCGLMLVLFVGWRMKRADVCDEFTNGGTLAKNGRIFPFMWFIIRYLAPVTILVIFVSNLL